MLEIRSIRQSSSDFRRALETPSSPRAGILEGGKGNAASEPEKVRHTRIDKPLNESTFPNFSARRNVRSVCAHG
jgi:hypothetical protein